MDRRIRKSQEAIKDALVDLLKDKSIEQITVSDLAKSADINRSTFYLHYKNIEDLIESIEGELAEYITLSVSHIETDQMINDPQALLQIFTKLLEAVKSESNLILALMDNPSKATTRVTIEQVIENIIIERMQGLVYTNQDEQDLEVSPTYVAVIFSSLFTSILIEWLSNGLKESPDQLAEFINQVAYQPIIQKLISL